MDWSYFHRVVMLTANPAEYALGQAECARVGLTVEPYHAVREIGPHQSFSHSERNILLEFLYDRDANRLLHLEDDVTFRNLDHLPQAINELPDDWDILYLGANLICWNNGEPQPERFSEHLWRVRAAWTTHAIGYNRRCVLSLLEKQPALHVQMWDQYVSEQLPQLNAYCIAPMVAWQRPRKSSIWLKEETEDYGPIFEASEGLLR
jgi:hypothetical protein